MKVVLFIVLALVLLVAIVLLRAAMLKETPAKTAKVELDTSARADV